MLFVASEDPRTSQTFSIPGGNFTANANMTVSVINSTNYESIANITVGESGPVSMAVDKSDNMLYVASEPSHAIYVINSTNYESIANITVGFNSPSDISLNEGNDILYVASEDYDSVSVINSTNYESIQTLLLVIVL